MGSMMISPGIQSVIFDFDYTLADSSVGIIDSANYALIRLGLPTATDKARLLHSPYNRDVADKHASGAGG